MKTHSTRTNQRRGRAQFLALSIVLLVATAACGEGADATGNSLEGSKWEMTSVRAGGSLVTADLTTIATAVFADGTVTGSDGCNLYRASYSTDGDLISIGDPALTGFACEPEFTRQAEAFIQAMQASERFSLSLESLGLADASDTTQLRFRPAGELPLRGVSWRLTGYTGREGGMVSPLSGTEISLNFLADGTLSGIAGCNSYNAGYQINGNELTVGDLTRTVIGCVEPDGIMTQERDYLNALHKTGSFVTSLTGLELSDSGGDPIAEYRFAGRTR